MRSLIVYWLLSGILLASCSQINKATDFVTNPSAKEKYQRDFDISNELFQIWEQQKEIAFLDSVAIDLPYSEKGRFTPRNFPVYSYEVELNPGESFQLTVNTDSIKNLVFMDVYLQTGDSIKSYKNVKSSEYENKNLVFEAETSGTYKIVIQPEINAHTGFNLIMEKKPVYYFPVSGHTNTAIQSYWGANRDAGVRTHEGIDIFAKRGTPVIAAVDGIVSSTGDRGLGGKQVWLRDRNRSQSLYYAHLDSINTAPRKSVKIGDTLGFVGNTGNARTTPPHLHFGIYKSNRGAIDPLPFVFITKSAEMQDSTFIPEFSKLKVISNSANLRNKPNTNSIIIAKSNLQDTLDFLGKSSNWYHVRYLQKSSFIHESLVSPL